MDDEKWFQLSLVHGLLGREEWVAPRAVVVRGEDVAAVEVITIGQRVEVTAGQPSSGGLMNRAAAVAIQYSVTLLSS